MTTENGSVELIGVTKRFGTVTAVDAIDIQVRPGEFLSLLGPSGCGKTTTLRMLAGFEEPDEGQIRISGIAVQGVPPHKRDVNTVFQNYALFPHMSVSENVAYGLRQKKVDKAEIGRRVGEALEMVKMGKLANRKPREMSGGQQQRVALARALVYSPSVLLLDEPFSNLDAKLRERARAWVKELQGTLGLTTIFVTHDQDEALSMSDRVAVMSAGQVQQIGTPEEIYRHPANRFVAEFVGRVNLIEGKVSASERDGVVVDVRGSSQQLTVHDGAGASGNVTVAVRPEAVDVMRLDDRSVNGTNTWEADVETVAFLGDHYEYEVNAGPVPLTVHSARRVEGDRIRVHIPPDACAVVVE